MSDEQMTLVYTRLGAGRKRLECRADGEGLTFIGCETGGWGLCGGAVLLAVFSFVPLLGVILTVHDAVRSGWNGALVGLVFVCAAVLAGIATLVSLIVRGAFIATRMRVNRDGVIVVMPGVWWIRRLSYDAASVRMRAKPVTSIGRQKDGTLVIGRRGRWGEQTVFLGYELEDLQDVCRRAMEVLGPASRDA